MGVPKIRGTLTWGPYNKDPTIKGTIRLGVGRGYYYTVLYYTRLDFSILD